jgi:hypothetical protein
MAVEKRQHEERNAIMVEIAGTAALADCGFPEKPAIKMQTTRNFISEIPKSAAFADEGSL